MILYHTKFLLISILLFICLSVSFKINNKGRCHFQTAISMAGFGKIASTPKDTESPILKVSSFGIIF